MQEFHQIEPKAKTPEELVEYLDLQIALARAKRSLAPRSRGAVLICGFVLIFAGAGFALMLRMQELQQTPHPVGARKSASNPAEHR